MGSTGNTESHQGNTGATGAQGSAGAQGATGSTGAQDLKEIMQLEDLEDQETQVHKVLLVLKVLLELKEIPWCNSGCTRSSGCCRCSYWCTTGAQREIQVLKGPGSTGHKVHKVIRVKGTNAGPRCSGCWCSGCKVLLETQVLQGATGNLGPTGAQGVAGSLGIPSGVLVLWSGAASTVPSGWVCHAMVLNRYILVLRGRSCCWSW